MGDGRQAKVPVWGFEEGMPLIRWVAVTVTLILLAAVVVFACGGDPMVLWDLDVVSKNWGIPCNSWILKQLDPMGPRFQIVDLPHPGWLHPPEEREGKMFPQVIVKGVVDLQEGTISPVDEAGNDYGISG